MAATDSDFEKPASAKPNDQLLDQDGKRLAESIDEASLLVWYASKKGLSDITPEVIEAITQSKAKFKSSSLTPNDEAQFWNGYRALAKLIAPVTVESIRASYDLDSQAKRNARKAINNYRISTLFVLAILVILQAYWFIGTSIKSNIENMREDTLGFNLAFIDFQARIKSGSDEFNEKNKEIIAIDLKIRNENNNEYLSNLKTDKNKLINELKIIEQNNTEDNKEFISYENRKKENSDKIKGNYLILGVWDFYTEMMMWFASDSERRPEAEKPMAPEGTDAAQPADGADNPKTQRENQSYDEWLKSRTPKLGAREQRQNNLITTAEENKNGNDNPPATNGKNNGTISPADIYTEDERREMSLLATSSVLALFNQYLLPLLYGLLGSLAYILRTLTKEIQDVTYTRGSNVRYQLRWPLGVLAGVTIGWFFDPETLKLAGTITPLGLAFLAGYSVELLFVGLDRIIGAFTGSQDGAKHPSGT